jgi:hypothetical protein
VREVSRFSIQVPDKPGEAFQVLSALVSGGVNLLACTGVARGGRATLAIVPDDTRRFRTAVKNAGLAFQLKKTGFLIQGGDRAGALAEHLAKLAAGGLNITGVDALSAGKGRWAAILWVGNEDVSRAGRLLGADPAPKHEPAARKLPSRSGRAPRPSHDGHPRPSNRQLPTQTRKILSKHYRAKYGVR